ncbi:MAG: universal stress protein [Anaerolineae bacterium]|jgi:nucleotide-binding universal stress UspA family protein
MGRILCATRGGEASRRTQDAAIALAKERGDELIFLYVADSSFLNNTAAPLVIDVGSRLVKMGEFQLLMAQERAAAQGVAAQTLVREGKLRAELVGAARELEVDLIVLGHPVDRHEQAIFDETGLQALATSLQTITGAKVRIL